MRAVAAEPLLRRIVPAEVRSAETSGDDPNATLFPEEVERIGRAVDKRRREYTSVRQCARQALGELGFPPAAILSGPRGEPLWQPGVVGSMTHCDGYRAAAMARATEVATVGIDAEPNQPLPDGVLDAISLPPERARLPRLTAADPSVHWDRLLFCAKEAVYKAWFPLTGEWLGFDQAEITFDAPARRFRARLLVPGPTVDGTRLPGFDGHWLTGNGLVLTAITVLTRHP